MEDGLPKRVQCGRVKAKVGREDEDVSSSRFHEGTLW